MYTYVFTHVCTPIYMYMHAVTHIYTYLHTYMRVYVRIYLHYLRVFTCIYVYKRVFTRVFTRIYMYLCVYMHVSTCVLKCTRVFFTRIYAYICIYVSYIFRPCLPSTDSTSLLISLYSLFFSKLIKFIKPRLAQAYRDWKTLFCVLRNHPRHYLIDLMKKGPPYQTEMFLVKKSH